jgi:hypothetical protein
LNGTDIHTQDDLHATIQTARKNGCIKLKGLFATDKSYGIHPQEGIPQLYFDQLNVIAKHLQEIAKARSMQQKHPTDQTQTQPCFDHTQNLPPDPDRGKFYKLKELKNGMTGQNGNSRNSRC